MIVQMMIRILILNVCGGEVANNCSNWFRVDDMMACFETKLGLQLTIIFIVD